ncbi:hypothetical protein [Halegenticoccus soli]|uniref:hypothetical protein n=1 Tax=Halegenticoccus soli TaxID=1985678 RepID=UPI001E3F2B21|nr:hypothetical protein [Halegenticoccus soli]
MRPISAGSSPTMTARSGSADGRRRTQTNHGGRTITSTPTAATSVARGSLWDHWKKPNAARAIPAVRTRFAVSATVSRTRRGRGLYSGIRHPATAQTLSSVADRSDSPRRTTASSRLNAGTCGVKSHCTSGWLAASTASTVATAAPETLATLYRHPVSIVRDD